MMKKKAKADILIMKHYNIQSTNERVEGFLDTIEGHDEYKIVEELTTTSEFEFSMEEMDRVINKGLKFDVVLGGNDPTALGALAGLQLKKADILIMKHYNIQSTNERVEGFLDTIEGHDEYKIVEELTTTSEFEFSMEEMDRVINKGLKFDVVLGGNDPTALGALAGLQLNHVTDEILIYGID